jgi:hypothetical protein
VAEILIAIKGAKLGGYGLSSTQTKCNDSLNAPDVEKLC